ncbi:AbiJ-related protein [Aureispira anguillae]|uniref:AAA family ATPase n=1 Tax=Aureispira anguillae TaxID=2864201 RepID=A0A916DTA2_9BACT|nr:AAA family ATPase [Aureispira anguillae]BDS11321.1 AAA family ATPase [Aureispira anguillae]
MITLSKKLKLELFNVILNEKSPFGFISDEDGLIPFLNKIWDLKNMPSTDPRFSTAEQDIAQHTIRNDDWELEFLFDEILNLFEDDSKYRLFIETILSPEFRETEDGITKYFYLINPYLEKESYALIINEYNNEDLPIYKVGLKAEAEELLIELKENTIPFIVETQLTGKSSLARSHKTPKTTPSFVLAFNSGWNDYSVVSSFSLFYYSEGIQYVYIGDVKIIHIETLNTSKKIPLSFNSLPDIFCSLGQNISYYNRLKEHFGKEFKSILFALRDAAFFPDIHEKYEQNSNFINSLIRTNTAERLLREAKYQVYNYDLSNLYSFKYTFQPKYSKESIEVDFNFNNNKNLPNRIYAIIGKNGIGKTQLISSLPFDIYKKKDDVFMPKTPLFSKVIAVSYSIFDSFKVPQKTASFNYLYCGLKDENGENISEKDLVRRFHKSSQKIKNLKRIQEWNQILLNFIDKQLLSQFIRLKRIDQRREYVIDFEGFSKIKNILSSGQNIILYIITEIVANIRYDSLLLYDEPETHLHPNAISQLINTIYELVNEFESYCILATHSPLIIRELLSRNVYILERFDDTPAIRKLNIETFGENLTTLTEEVFGNREIPKQYKIILENLVYEGKNYEQILSLLESDNIPLSLNAKIYIKSLLNEKY